MSRWIRDALEYLVITQDISLKYAFEDLEKYEGMKEDFKSLKEHAEVGKIIIQAVEDDEISASEIERILNLYREQESDQDE